MSIKKVFLLQPLHQKLFQNKGERESFNFPYGMASVARVLEDNGFGVEVLDAQVMQLDDEEVCAILKKKEFDILGISAFSTQYVPVKKISKFVKEVLGDRLIVIGGSLGIHSAEVTLETTDVDICVTGEGEEVVIDLLKNLDSLGNVLGIAYKKNNQVVVNPERPYVENLDDLPRPAYHLFPMEKYLKYNITTGKYGRKKETKDSCARVMNFISQRGCPYRCTFCSKNFKGLRFMSAKKIIGEIKFLKESYGLTGIHLGDELFISNREMVKDFLPMMKELNLVWDCQCRVNLVDDELLKEMKAAGCVGIGYGIESGSQRILDNMKKDTTVKQIENAMFLAKKHDLYVKVQLIFGFPGEDEQSLEETIDLFKRVNHPGRRFNYITPLPGSRIYDDALEQGIIKNEAEYLKKVEIGGGAGKILVNYTKWPNEMILPLMGKTAKEMRKNYFLKNPSIFLNFLAQKVTKKLLKTFKFKQIRA